MTLLFLAGVGFQELIVLLFMLGFFVGIIVAIRGFFLWYWKVNDIVANQERQINLLKELVELQKANQK
jgi:hypothetical protein